MKIFSELATYSGMVVSTVYRQIPALLWSPPQAAWESVLWHLDHHCLSLYSHLGVCRAVSHPFSSPSHSAEHYFALYLFADVFSFVLWWVCCRDGWNWLEPAACNMFSLGPTSQRTPLEWPTAKILAWIPNAKQNRYTTSDSRKKQP